MKKVQGRLRGFMALMLAMMIAMGFMPMQSVKAANPELSYFLVCYGTGEKDTQFVGKGRLIAEDASSSGVYHEFSRSGNYDYNGWLEYDNDDYEWDILPAHAAAIKIEDDSLEVGDDHEINIKTNGTKFYYGSVASGNLRVKVKYLQEEAYDGTRGMGTLNAGKYKINYVGYKNSTFEFALTSGISISQTALTMTEGDAPQKLSVAPAKYDIVWESDDDSVAKVDSNGQVTAVEEGATYIRAYIKEDEDTEVKCRVTVKDDPDPFVDEPIKDKEGKDTGYVVSNANKANFQATYKGTAADRKAKKVTILDEITDDDGNVFKVTAIAKEALKNAKGKELIIGKNIKKIGKKALKNAKFKKITIKTDKKGKIKIEKDAFKVKSKKCTVKIKGIKKSNKQKLSNKILKQASKGVTIK